MLTWAALVPADEIAEAVHVLAHQQAPDQSCAYCWREYGALLEKLDRVARDNLWSHLSGALILNRQVVMFSGIIVYFENLRKIEEAAAQYKWWKG